MESVGFSVGKRHVVKRGKQSLFLKLIKHNVELGISYFLSSPKLKEKLDGFEVIIVNPMIRQYATLLV